MAVLSSQMIGEFGFSANSSTSEEISAFVAESLREISGFVRRDGDSNVGPLHLSSGLSVDVESHVGPGNVINVMYGAAVGEGNVVGVRGYEVRSVSADAETSDADVQFALGEGEELDERIVPGLKTSSTGFQRSTVEFGVVKSVDRASGRAVVNVPDPMIRNDLGGKTLYFTDASGRLVNAGNAVTSGSWSVAVGSNNVVTGSCSRAGGHLSQTIGTYGNAHGKGAVAAWAATAEGCAVRALANASCAWNRATKVGQGASYSVAEGTGTVVDQNMKNCHVAGYMARAKDEGAFVWNGARVSCAFLDPTMTLHREPHAAQGWKVPGTALEGDNDAMTQEFIDHPAALSSMYASHGEGTFNVNPQGGLGGFYVGERSLLDAVEGAVTAAISVEIGRLKDDVWTGNIYVAGSPEEKTYVKRADLPPGGSFSYRGLPAGAPLSDLQPDEDLVEVVALADRYASVSDYAFAKCARLRRATLLSLIHI